jgi:hypothetical protein
MKCFKCEKRLSKTDPKAITVDGYVCATCLYHAEMERGRISPAARLIEGENVIYMCECEQAGRCGQRVKMPALEWKRLAAEGPVLSDLCLEREMKEVLRRCVARAA